ncbi:VOC family protein [Devosia salina]|uniref:VOC family protein n=1 Tax=Devosia salina TaxID=2860336 RepID=A0ABX8WFL0_9HYPH|nr:VOC family protein [Devosia salina]QYO75080.1 VOC family protein [Devosia salina]
MARLKELVIDSDVPSRLAKFWADALDGYSVMPYDDEEIARLASLGLTPETDPSVMIIGPGIRLCFQLREGPRPQRNRLHLEVEALNVDEEMTRFTVLGANYVRREKGYVVMTDPEGNNFCICQGPGGHLD